MPHSISRRGFVSLASAAGLGIAAAHPALAPWATPKVPADDHAAAAGGRLTVTMPDASPHLRSLIRSATPPAMVGRVDWRWGLQEGVSWAGDDLRLHTRYTPSPHAAGFTDSDVSSDSEIEQIPYGVLINRAKARKAGVEKFDLAGLRRRGVHAQFPFSGTGSAPENSWMLPALAPVVAAFRAAPDSVGASSLVRRASIALSQAIGTSLRGLDLQASDEAGSLERYERLLDPRSEVVAMYGSPVHLHAARLSSPDPRSSAVTVVPLQGFLHTIHPAFFASSLLQVGRSVDPQLAAPLVEALREPGIRPLLSVQARYIDRAPTREDTLPLASTMGALLTTHKPGYYRGLPDLGYLLDGGLLARLVISIHSALVIGAGRRSDDEVAGYALSHARSTVSTLRALGMPLSA